MVLQNKTRQRGSLEAGPTLANLDDAFEGFFLILTVDPTC